MGGFGVWRYEVCRYEVRGMEYEGWRYVGINKEVRDLDTRVHENKGFARRPQEFPAWEMGGRM